MEIIKHEEALTILSRIMDPSDPTTMLEAVRLLAAVCLVTPNGSVLSTLSSIHMLSNTSAADIFENIVISLCMHVVKFVMEILPNSTGGNTKDATMV